MHVWVLLLFPLFFSLLLEHTILIEASNEEHDDKSTNIGPVPWVNVIKETLINHFGQLCLIVVVASVAGNSTNQRVASKSHSSKDAHLIEDLESENKADESAGDAEYPEEPLLMSVEKDSLVDDESKAVTTPCSQDGNSKLHKA